MVPIADVIYSLKTQVIIVEVPLSFTQHHVPGIQQKWKTSVISQYYNSNVLGTALRGGSKKQRLNLIIPVLIQPLNEQRLMKRLGLAEKLI